jgi:hypothetical protein
MGAYEALLDAVVEKDLGFIRSVCEPQLADRFAAGLERLEQEGKVVQKYRAAGEARFEVSYLKLMMHLGQKLERSQRASGKLSTKMVDSVGLELSFSLDMINPSNMVIGSFKIGSLISVLVEVQSSIGLDIFDPKVRLHEKPRAHPELQTHSLQFGFENNKAVSTMAIFSLLPSLQKQTDPLARIENILGLLIEENYNWSILDVDYWFKD